MGEGLLSARFVDADSPLTMTSLSHPPPPPLLKGTALGILIRLTERDAKCLG